MAVRQQLMRSQPLPNFRHKPLSGLPLKHNREVQHRPRSCFPTSFADLSRTHPISGFRSFRLAAWALQSIDIVTAAKATLGIAQLPVLSNETVLRYVDATLRNCTIAMVVNGRAQRKSTAAKQ
jgi:hypothetical protein